MHRSPHHTEGERHELFGRLRQRVPIDARSLLGPIGGSDSIQCRPFLAHDRTALESGRPSCRRCCCCCCCCFVQGSLASGVSAINELTDPEAPMPLPPVDKSTWLVLYCGANPDVERVSDSQRFVFLSTPVSLLLACCGCCYSCFAVQVAVSSPSMPLSWHVIAGFLAAWCSCEVAWWLASFDAPRKQDEEFPVLCAVLTNEAARALAPRKYRELPPVNFVPPLVSLHGVTLPLGSFCAPMSFLGFLPLFPGGGKYLRQAQGEMAQRVLRQVVGTAGDREEGRHARVSPVFYR